MRLKIRRTSEARWRGDVETGAGTIALGSGAFIGPYSLRSRIGDEPQTNPEELVGAAHAGCFAMSLSNLLSASGFFPREIGATSTVNLEETDTGFSVTEIRLRASGDVPGLDEERFVQLAEEAKRTCPISRALAGTAIRLEAQLVSTGVEAA